VKLLKSTKNSIIFDINKLHIFRLEGWSSGLGYSLKLTDLEKVFIISQTV